MVATSQQAVSAAASSPIHNSAQSTEVYRFYIVEPFFITDFLSTEFEGKAAIFLSDDNCVPFYLLVIL
jgi:hypothetical protein